MPDLSSSDLLLDPQYYPAVNRWLQRGDGIAVYENQDMGHPDLGHRQYVSFGSTAAQLETNEPPQRLPDVGTAINWRYYLVGTYKGELLHG